MKTSTCQALSLILIPNWMLFWGESDRNLKTLHIVHQSISTLYIGAKGLKKGWTYNCQVPTVIYVSVCFYLSVEASAWVWQDWCDNKINSSCVSIWLRTCVKHIVKNGLIIGWLGDTCMNKWVFRGERGARGKNRRWDGRLPYSFKWDRKSDGLWLARRIQMIQKKQDYKSLNL